MTFINNTLRIATQSKSRSAWQQLGSQYKLEGPTASAKIVPKNKTMSPLCVKCTFSCSGFKSIRRYGKTSHNYQTNKRACLSNLYNHTTHTSAHHANNTNYFNRTNRTKTLMSAVELINSQTRRRVLKSIRTHTKDSFNRLQEQHTDRYTNWPGS